ncbi:MAG: efflux RND transporter permease subunit, partial [bacterium]|nr:efflux RND transporter permease subunit [bacterium]
MINQLIKKSLENRFLTIMFFLALVILGVIFLYRTPVDALPDLSENQVIVMTEWPGQSPKNVEDQVT